MIELVHKMMSSAQFEVFLVYFVAGLGIFVKNVIYQTHLVGKQKSRSWIFIFEFCCLVVPMVLVESIHAEHLFKAIAPLIFLIVLFMFWTLKILCETSTSTSTSPLIAPPSNVGATEALYNSIASFKAMVLITTTIAILAVDFPIFPSRFAKTDSYGHTLMDSGTAAFIFVSALSDYTAILRAGGDLNKRSKSAYISILSVRIPSIFVLLLLGVGRTIFVKFFAYQNPVTEYGLHWNFFVTLFCLRMYVITVKYPNTVWTGLLLGLVYQCALSKHGLEEWILKDDLTNPRIGFVDENREGIFSLLGYIFLYSLAMIYVKLSTAVLLSKEKLSISGIFTGFSFTAVCLLLQVVLELNLLIQPSRRLSNVTYSFSMAALFSFSLSGLQLLNFFVGSPASTCRVGNFSLAQAISRNGMIYFLVANLLTGLINMLSIPGQAISSAAPTTLFLMFYSFITAFIVYIVNMRREKRD